MKCVQCRKDVRKPYAHTYRYNSDKSVWEKDGGVVCSELCGQLWSKKPDHNFNVRKT